MKCPVCSGKQMLENTVTGAPEKCTLCNGKGTISIFRFGWCIIALGGLLLNYVFSEHTHGQNH